MKDTIKTSRTAGYLEKIFRTLNADSFGGALEEPIITIQSTPGTYGHITVAKTWKRKDDWRHELNISADYLQRPIEEVVATMIHEMTHLYNELKGIQDCSRGGSYHNKHFKTEAEKHMVAIEKSDKYGWTITKVTDELLEYIIDKGWSDIEMGKGFGINFRGGSDPKTGNSNPGITPKISKPKGNSRKHTCPCCGAIARTTKDIKLICGACMKEMIMEVA